jgi:hypothetical protein
MDAMENAIRTAVKVFFNALLDMSHKPAQVFDNIAFPEPQNCSKPDADLRWPDGRKMYK